jgi:hypothetical protein
MKSPGAFVTGRGTGWEGYLQPAGLKGGTLAVEPESKTGDRWMGRKPAFAVVRLTAYYGGGPFRLQDPPSGATAGLGLRRSRPRAAYLDRSRYTAPLSEVA